MSPPSDARSNGESVSSESVSSEPASSAKNNDPASNVITSAKAPNTRTSR
ncbi:hypothetical protein NVSP9465_01087 [Novosphingobium sp. CECT 9465]|nr:hypothetical protein NVSP9465_01087 [Novosphingobium sp. CECT 9465]